MNTKSKSGGYIIRSAAAAVLLSSGIVTLTWAIGLSGKSFSSSSQASGGQLQQVSGAQTANQHVSYQTIQVASVAVIDFKELARADAEAARSRPANEPPVFIAIPEPAEMREPQGAPLPPAPAAPPTVPAGPL